MFHFVETIVLKATLEPLGSQRNRTRSIGINGNATFNLLTSFLKLNKSIPIMHQSPSKSPTQQRGINSRSSSSFTFNRNMHIRGMITSTMESSFDCYWRTQPAKRLLHKASGFGVSTSMLATINTKTSPTQLKNSFHTWLFPRRGTEWLFQTTIMFLSVWSASSIGTQFFDLNLQEFGTIGKNSSTYLTFFL